MNIANEYWNKHFPALTTKRKETDYGYTIRNTWRKLGFPKYPVVDEYLNLPAGTTKQYAHKYNYTEIKTKFEELQNQIQLEQQEKKQSEMEEDYSKIWKTARNSIKYRINDLTKKIQTTVDEKELEKLWKKYYEGLNELKGLQPIERTNNHLTNKYKDNSVDKLKIEQSGNLTVKQNITNDGLSKEEREKEYETEFKRLLQEATGNPTNDAQDL